MSRVPPDRLARVVPNPRLEALLRDLGTAGLRSAGLQRGVRERTAQRATGIPDIDRLLGGGVPLGALCEISGRVSSGRTSLLLALLAETTRAGELVGLVDAADAFDPISAERAGVDLDRVLWVRAQTLPDALRSSERLLQTEGFPLVVFDFGLHGGEQRGASTRGGVSTSSWLRLTRLAAASRTALLLISNERLAGSHAAVALSLEPARAHFTGTPPLLEALEARAALVRHRTAPIDRTAAVLLSSSAQSARPAQSSVIPDTDASEPPHESAA